MYINTKTPVRTRADSFGYRDKKLPRLSFVLSHILSKLLADAEFYFVSRYGPYSKPVMLLFTLLIAAIAWDAVSALPAQAQDTPAAQQPAKSSDTEEDLINADRPGIANGSQVIGPRRFQIEIGIEQDLLGGKGSASRLLTVPTLLRFGIDTRYELRIETAGFSRLSSPAPTGTQHTQGLAPVSIGFKRQFQTSKGPAHPSIGTIVRFFPGSGSGAFRSNHFTGDALLAMDWDFMPKLSLNPNIGYAIYEDNAGKSFANFHFANTLTYAPTTRLNFFVDFGLQSPETTGGNTSLIYDGGVTYILGRNIQLDFSVGTGILGKTVPHPFWATGVSVRF